MKVALITGVTGQDGSYLAELLLSREDLLSLIQLELTIYIKIHMNQTGGLNYILVI